MSRSVTFKLRGQALEAALKFSTDLGMPLNMAAEKALLWAMRQAYAQPNTGTLTPGPDDMNRLGQPATTFVPREDDDEPVQS